METETGRVIVITGAMAAGKSTVAQVIAEQLPRSVHLRGDAFRRMIVNGLEPMNAALSGAALAQLRLRHELTAAAANRYATAGFDVVVQDVIIGSELSAFLARIDVRHRYLVVLAPTIAELERRERHRAKTGYAGLTPSVLDGVLRDETPRIGYWLDSTGQTADETAAEILRELPRAKV